MKHIILTCILLLLPESLLAGNNSEKVYSESEVREMVHKASESDGKLGITPSELKSVFGEPSRMETKNNLWSTSPEYIWQISKTQYLQVTASNENVFFIRLFNTNNNHFILIWK